jgi:hypothetical protein
MKTSFSRAFKKIVKFFKVFNAFRAFSKLFQEFKIELLKSFFKIFFDIFSIFSSKENPIKIVKEMQISHIENSCMIKKKKKNSNDLKSWNFL